MGKKKNKDRNNERIKDRETERRNERIERKKEKICKIFYWDFLCSRELYFKHLSKQKEAERKKRSSYFV